MKKIYLILIGLFVAFGSIAQETKTELKTRFDVIRNETVAGANTKTRIANAYQELADASQGIYYIEASASVANTYTASLLNLDAYADKWFIVQFLDNNTGSATLNINSIGAATIKKDGNTNLIADDIDSLDVHILAYDGTNFQILTLGASIGPATANEIAYWPTTTTLGSLTTATYPSLTELSRVKGVTSAIQTQIDGKSPTAGNASLVTTGTLTTGATGAGFTIALGTSTVTGALPVANLTAKYILDQATPSTSGGTITLDMNSQIQRSHVGSASFSGPKTIALSNTTNSLVFNFYFNVTNVAAVLTMPSDFKLPISADWDGSAWTPPATGEYEMGGSFDDVNNIWYIKIAGPFN